MNAKEMIISFVEGRMLPAEFEQLLFSQEALKKELANGDFDIMPYADRGELYQFLIEKNYNSVTELWDIHDALSIFLHKNGIEFKASDLYEQQGKMLLKIQPSWVDMPGWYFSVLLDENREKSGKELELSLRKAIKEKFKFMNKPPKWLQSPAWPIVDGHPMLFIAQIDLSKIRHDTAFAYLFHSDVAGYKVIEQTT
ncbi:MAG: hypothetical protein LBL69_06645 [Zoogloeaceae bacterium]|jgi:hypothetical protein|nr:hypothetical protein [Zoogloeaceae bacterium]